MTTLANLEAVLAAVNVTLAPKQAKALHEIPNPRPSEYVAVVVARRFGGNLTLGARGGVVGYRVAIEAVSQVSGSNVATSLEKCRAALECVRLAVGDQRTTPIQFETEDPTGYDDGWFSGRLYFTYCI